MKKYIGTKQIEAEPMTLGEACSKGLVKSEIEENESYKLGYHTRTEYGYESWSPKELFEESYREVKEEIPICFGDAIEVLKQGGAIRSTRNHRRVTKPTAKMPNGSATCICVVWSRLIREIPTAGTAIVSDSTSTRNAKSWIRI